MNPHVHVHPHDTDAMNYLNAQIEALTGAPGKRLYVAETKDGHVQPPAGLEISFLELQVPCSTFTRTQLTIEQFDFHIRPDVRANMKDIRSRQGRPYEIIVMNKQLVNYLMTEKKAQYYHYYARIHRAGGVEIDLPGDASVERGPEIVNIIERTRDWVDMFETKFQAQRMWQLSQSAS